MFTRLMSENKTQVELMVNDLPEVKNDKLMLRKES